MLAGETLSPPSSGVYLRTSSRYFPTAPHAVARRLRFLRGCLLSRAGPLGAEPGVAPASTARVGCGCRLRARFDTLIA
jgi:hypothetical protein